MTSDADRTSFFLFDGGAFDNDFREKVLNKHADFRTPQEVAELFDSICLMVGIRGQTREMIRNEGWNRE